MLSEIQWRSLKNKVLKHNVKSFPKEIVEFLNHHSSQPSLIGKCVDVLVDFEYLTWPLSEDDHNMVVRQFNNKKAIPRYLQLIVSQRWAPSIPNFNQFTTHQKLYHYVNNIEVIPVCRCCSNNTRWSTTQGHYTLHCSNKCRAIDPLVEAKRKQTSVKRHGHDTLLSNNTHLQKTRDTLKEREGVYFPFNKTELRDNALRSCEEKHGIGFASNQGHKALKQKYGDISFGEMFADTKTRQKAMTSRLEKWLPGRLKSLEMVVRPLFNLTDFQDRFQQLQYECVACDTRFEDCLRDGKTPRCPSCYPINRVNWNQNTLYEYCKTIGPVQESIRSIISPKELDIYFPDQKIAIEYNGLYWHNNIGSGGRVDKQYHLNKTKACAVKGIQLLHVFEDEWLGKQRIVESMIAAKIGCTQNKLYARKCSIQQIDFVESAAFLNANHIQGESKSTVQFGLFFENTLVSLMTFGSPRFNKQHEWELIRFCNRANTTVVGGASKLLAAFKQLYTPQSIITYADRRYSNGNLYEKLGFVFDGNTPPNYFYVSLKEGCTIRYSRMKFQKHKLSTLLKNFDPQLSESKNMENNGYAKIWDCGSMRFVQTL